ncbi:hypothetical protein AOLI_G00028140 [Acnodon oligacanthus]
MKPCSIAAIGVLLFALCSVTVSEYSHGPQKCCFSYAKTKIPAAVVVHFEMTSPACNQPGVIFHTNKQIERCADPGEKWVQRLMNMKS